MNKKLLNEIIACLPKGKTLFYYFKDRYACMLLADYVGVGKTVRQVKKSAYAGLLNRPLIKEVLANSGNGVLTADMFNSVWHNSQQPFVLTLSEWGGKDRSWFQVSRTGYNLVLQLNFSASHDREYAKLDARDYLLFGSLLHPVMQKGERELFRYTVAWSRIDLDFGSGEALIEEVQSDWIRNCRRAAGYAKQRLEACGQDQGAACNRCALTRMVNYYDKAIAPYAVFWEEAMLSAAIDFIHNELGIKVIYYHSWDTGCRIKGIGQYRPPRSLYSDLPQRFCFQSTTEAPGFLSADRGFRRVYRKVKDPQWYVLTQQGG